MLGFVYVKLAQSAQSGDPDATATKLMRSQLGADQQTPVYGSLPNQSGSASVLQFVGPLMTDAGGQEAGALVQSLMPLFMQFLPPEMATALSKQRRIAAGAGTTAEAQRISAILTQANGRLMAKHADVLANTLGSIAQSKDVPAVMKPMLQWAASAAKSQPGAIGGLIAAVRGMDIPVVSELLNQYMRDTPTSYMPIVQASFIENNGALDEQHILARVAEFEDNQKRGLYVDREGNPMDASVAIGGFGLAARAFGNEATPQQRVELARLADSVMKHGLASSPNAAYAIVQQLGTHQALGDPEAFDSKMAQFGQRIKALSPPGGAANLAMGALEMAAKSGMPLDHALENIVSDGERRQTWERSGKTPQQVAALGSLAQATEVTRNQGFAQADSTKGLAAWVTQTAQGRSAYQDFVADPTADKAAKMFSAARQAPTWASRGAFDPSVIKSYLGPNQMSALQMGEQISFAGMMGGGGKKSQLSQIMRDPERYRTMIEDPLSMTAADQKQFAALPYYMKKHLSNPGVRGVTVDYLANQDAARIPRPAPALEPYKQLTPDQVTAPIPKQPSDFDTKPEVPGARPSTP